MDFENSFILGYALGIFVLACVSIGFAIYRIVYCGRLVKNRLCDDKRSGQPLGARRLTFHSTEEDKEKLLLQSGFKTSLVGQSILVGWFAMMIAAFIAMVVLATVSYYYDIYTSWGTDWNGIMGPYIVVFAIFHIIVAFMIQFYDSIRTKFMLPEIDLGEATHVLIEEEVPEMDDSDMLDPGMAKEERIPKVFLNLINAWRGLVLRYKQASRKTLIKIQNEDGDRTIEYTCVRYYYDGGSDRFRPVGRDENVSVAEAVNLVNAGGLSEPQADSTRRVVGTNEIRVRVPGIFESLITEFSSLFYVVQSMGSWTYLGYSGWNVGLVWLLMMIVTGCIKALFIVRKSQKKISRLAQHSADVKVLRNSCWVVVDSKEVVLGDIIMIEEQENLPCDGYVVGGTVVVNESMLTGEPLPVQKVAAEKYDGAKFAAKNMVYAGTLCMQSTGPHLGHAVMVVTAVGGLTSKGQLVRMVMFPQSVRFKYHDQLPIVYGIMFAYAILLSILYFVLTDMGDWIVTILQVLVTVLQSLNPMLPVAMVMGQTVAAKRLRNHHKIFCLQPERIPVAGKISIMVFDKTGTITKDGMELSGAVPVENGVFSERVDLSSTTESAKLCGSMTVSDKVAQSPLLLQYGLAACHTVTSLRDGQLVGNQVEVAMVKASGWSLPAVGSADMLFSSPDGSSQLRMVRQLEFEHTRMTSGCVVRDGKGDLIVIVKGSYEKVQAECDDGAVPGDYVDVCERLSSGNFYVLGMGSKVLDPKLADDDVLKMTRDELEAGLSLVGLLLFKNEVKPDSALAISMLREGDIRSVVCTGDNPLTAIGISKEVGIIDDTKPVLLAHIVTKDKGGSSLVWSDPESGDEMTPVKGVHQLVVTRGAWRYLYYEEPDELEKYWYDILVYARMKPSDKVSVVKWYQSHKLVVGMCGDGGNDCGALRAAHAAMALSQAEASMVSPFSSCRDGCSLITVVDLIREGRACLATNLATYSYYIVYAFVLTGVRISGTIIGNNNLGEWVYLMTDLLLGVGMVWTMTLSGPTKKLAAYRPTASLLGWRTILSCAVPIVCSYLCQIIAYAILWSPKNADWYYYVNTLDLNIQAKDWTKKGDNYDSAVQVFVLLVILVTHCYTASYGGAFRCNILRNWSLNIFYLAFTALSFALLWVDPCDLSCVYRVSCDSGASLATGEIPFVSQFSVGNIGGCFLGTQIHRYQLLGFPNWTPDSSDECMPPQAALDLLPYDSPEISTLGYDGPNNVFSTGYRIDDTIILGSAVVFLHLFVKVGLLGPVAGIIRRWQGSRKASAHPLP